MGDDDVVERVVAAAEAGEADFEDHVGLGLTVVVVLLEGEMHGSTFVGLEWCWMQPGHRNVISEVFAMTYYYLMAESGSCVRFSVETMQCQ